jgi:hypothetical protein
VINWSLITKICHTLVTVLAGDARLSGFVGLALMGAHSIMPTNGDCHLNAEFERMREILAHLKGPSQHLTKLQSTETIHVQFA